MASLYQSSSAVSVAVSSLVSIDDSTFMAAASRQAAEQHRGIACRVDPQADAAPLDRVALPGDEGLHRRDIPAVVAGAGLDGAERQPQFRYGPRKRNGDRNVVDR